MKTILLWVMAGAILGAVVASVVVPPMLSWYNEPGSISPGKQVETLCNLPELIRYTSARLIRGQLIGAGVGAVLFLMLGVMLGRRRGAAASETGPLPPAHA